MHPNRRRPQRDHGAFAMKCLAHAAESVGVCRHCGRALCPACVAGTAIAPARLACSEACATALAREEALLQMLLQKSRQSARANSVYCYSCGVLSAGAAVASYFWLPVPMLMWFLAASALALIISGFWFGRGVGKISP